MNFINKDSLIQGVSSNFISDLSSLSMLDRRAALGLMTGLAPAITIQTPNIMDAENAWVMNYNSQLRMDLKDLKNIISFNIDSILNIAKNVFIARSMMSSDTLIQMFVQHILNETKRQEEELTTDQLMEYQLILVTATGNLTRNRNIASVTNLDLDGIRNMSKAIFDARNMYNRAMPYEEVRNFALTYIDICNKLTKAPSIELDSDVESLLLKEVFFPIALPNNADKENRHKLLFVIGEYKWNV